MGSNSCETENYTVYELELSSVSLSFAEEVHFEYFDKISTALHKLPLLLVALERTFK